jgi:hypothetical protein
LLPVLHHRLVVAIAVKTIRCVGLHLLKRIEYCNVIDKSPNYDNMTSNMSFQLTQDDL